MRIDTFRHFIVFAVLLLLHALLFQHIQLFGCVTPLVYTYFVISMHRDEPRCSILLWCFALGMAVDMFQNTQGLTAASLTLMGLIQPYVLSLFTNRETLNNFQATLRTLGMEKYVTYVTLLLLPFSVVLFTLYELNQFHWFSWWLSIIGSYLLTLILVILFEAFLVRE